VALDFTYTVSPVSMQIAITPTTAPSWFFTRSVANHSLKNTVWFFMLF
jgi:hypothetical protein